MADRKTVRGYEAAARQALQAFCREYTGRDDDWIIETWIDPLTKTVETATVLPEFDGISMIQRVSLLGGYLRAHLPGEVFGHVSLWLGLTPDEYEYEDWRPPQVQLALVPA